MKAIGIGEAAQRTGLTRHQIIYIDDRGYLGDVGRVRDARRFSEEQVALLGRVASLRRLDMRLEDAAALAGAHGSRLVHDAERLLALASEKAGEIELDLKAWIYLCSLIQRTVAGAAAQEALAP